MICSTYRMTVLLSLGICLLTPCGLAATGHHRYNQPHARHGVFGSA